MSITEFLHKLSGLCRGSRPNRPKVHFRVSSFGSIVTDAVPVSPGTYAASPILAAYAEVFPDTPPLGAMDEDWAAARLGLEQGDTRIIVAACQGYADLPHFSQGLRNDILLHCNLPTEPLRDGTPTRPRNGDIVVFDNVTYTPQRRLDNDYAEMIKLQKGRMKDPAEFIELYRQAASMGAYPRLLLSLPGQRGSLGQLQIEVHYSLPPTGEEQFAKSCVLHLASIERAEQGMLQIVMLLLAQDKINPMRSQKAKPGEDRTRVIEVETKP